ncbi:DDHD domain-containing protein [Aspergillus granulosus]|uniref:DDHD domain-containing protein n=1 Tax=Aspergillus granulosus TaxID=176169 RepID=A0ABR4H6T5_9EURO
MCAVTFLAVTPSASCPFVVSNFIAARYISYARRPTVCSFRGFMAPEPPKGTAFSGTFSSKSGSENANGQPTVSAYAQDILLRSKGEDHTVSHRHRLSLRHYPADCPPLKVRWFYAVDSPKWKPSLSDQKRENSKPLPQPRKFVPFTPKDSQSVEHAFQDLCNIEIEREQAHYTRPMDKARDDPVKVPVNEDYLFDVNINQRELGPSYWLGPVYEVRRGSWFFQEGSTIKPCEENLATQLEEGYLKVKPWRSENIQPLAQPLPPPNGQEQESGLPGSINEARKYRLFGSYMNSIVTYQDSTTALLTSDDFMSRVSTTVYQTLGGVAGTKLVRGFNETKKQNEAQDKKSSDQKSASDSVPLPSGPLPRATDTSRLGSGQDQLPKDPTEMGPERALERRVSSLASTQDTTELEEQARRQEEKEMEDLREADDEDREREIDHLVLVTHGIGQRLGLRLESVNFIHDVNVLRKTMKSVYKASPDLQALNSTFPDKQKNCRIQVLPVCWRHLLEFPYKKFGQNRRELDLADPDALEDDTYPSLSDITLESVPAVRNLISDLAVDVLLYQSKYCEHITSIVKQECNRIVELYRKRNPSFKGSVSLCGHSLGSAILFDILCSGDPEPRKAAHLGAKAGEKPFAFECEEFFCLGSPVALFQMLKGNRIAGRPPLQDEESEVSLDLADHDNTVNATFKSKRQSANFSAGGMMNEDQFAVSVPQCRQLYNIFHPSDPVSYRMEPLISPAMSSLKPQPLPSVKRSIWTASGQSLSMIGTRVGQSVGSLWTNFTSGVASSLLNRSLGISSDEGSSQSSSARPQQQSSLQPSADSLEDRSPTVIDPEIETLYEGFQKAKLRRQKADRDSKGELDPGQADADRGLRKLRLEDEKVRLLNSNGRVDYSIQECVLPFTPSHIHLAVHPRTCSLT